MTGHAVDVLVDVLPEVLVQELAGAHHTVGWLHLEAGRILERRIEVLGHDTRVGLTGARAGTRWTPTRRPP